MVSEEFILLRDIHGNIHDVQHFLQNNPWLGFWVGGGTVVGGNKSKTGQEMIIAKGQERSVGVYDTILSTFTYD